MICLTGDVHHMSLNSRDQEYLRTTELDSALSYLEIAQRNSLKVTFFFTGRLGLEEGARFAQLKRFDNLEIGGHTFSAFRPRWFYAVSRRLLGLSNGPYFWQRRDIARTLAVLEACVEQRVVSWRDHAYHHDRHTMALLSEQGVRWVSDEVDMSAREPRYHPSGLISVPINVLPDHDYVYHGWLTPERVRTQQQPGTHHRFYSVETWEEKVKEQVEQIVSDGGLATLLIHPACMEIVDGFRRFEALCEFLASFESVCMRDVKMGDEG